MHKRGLEKGRYLSLYVVTALICVAIIILFSVLLVSGVFSDGKDEGGRIVSDPDISISEFSDVSDIDMSSDSEVSDDIKTPAFETKLIAIQADALQEGSLILINSVVDDKISDKDKGLLTNIYNKKPKGLYKLSGTSLVLEEVAFKAFNEMLKDFYQATGDENILINNAYLTLSELEEKKLQDTFPDLTTGYSLRVAVYPSDKGKMGQGIHLWVEDNCYKYGFVLRYPESKTEATDKPHSPSVYRYVGLPHSEIMKTKNLSLEEYIEFIKDYTVYKPLEFIDTETGTKTVIYFIDNSQITGGLLTVPSEFSYWFSGNNKDGFVITADAK